MDKKENDFLRHLLETFRIEAEEHLKALYDGLIELEKAPSPEDRQSILEGIYREAHSLKGAARSVNKAGIESLCRALEDVFSALRRSELAPSPPLYDKLHETLDNLKALLAKETGRTPSLAGIGEAAHKAKRDKEEDEATAVSLEDAVKPASPVRERTVIDTVRVSTAKLDSLLFEAEEMLVLKQITGRHHYLIKGLRQEMDKWSEGFGRVHSRMRRSGGDAGEITGFIDWNYRQLQGVEERITELEKAADQDRRLAGAMVDNLMEDMMGVLMLPFSFLTGIASKIVRDLSREQAKEIELLIRGDDIEVDKRILEVMKAPLIHLLRNCIDHGIETPEERVRKKKTPSGRIVIDISQINGKVRVLITDDGAGIESRRVRETAIKSGLITPEEANKLDEKGILSLIFRSELSTSPTVTDVSGRGLGLAIVKEKVEELGGSVSVDTEPGKGTSFSITFPLSLATFRGLIVEVAGMSFVVPLSNVEHVLSAGRDDIKTIENREAISFGGETLSFVYLNDVLGLSRADEPDRGFDAVKVIVLSGDGKRIAFAVDDILNEQEILLKSLGRQLSRLRNISGATILSSGSIAPVLNVTDLIRSAIKSSAVTMKRVTERKEARTEKRNVLVVEDSITSRMLLKNILESAGYSVRTAVNGIDALTALKAYDFDLVLTDVEMPGMDGFELTRRVRADKRLSELPVVLVTALESDKDKERGIDAGASAYIVKSGFDQTDLLGTVRRLI